MDRAVLHQCSGDNESSLYYTVYPCCLPSVTYALHGPTDSIYSEKGIMTPELFLKWLDHFIKHALAAWTLILITDQHEAHCHLQVTDVCRANRIETLLLPPHTTHILKPLVAGLTLYLTCRRLCSPMTTQLRVDRVVGKIQLLSVTCNNITSAFRKATIRDVSEIWHKCDFV